MLNMLVLAVNSWSIGNVLVTIVVIAACVALLYIALRQFGVSIPDWVIQIFWIVAVAFAVIMAIRFVLTL